MGWIAQSFAALFDGVGRFIGSLDATRLWESRNTTLVLGWLLGLASAPLAEWVKDRRRKNQVAIAIRRELHELQYRLALVSFSVELDVGDGFNRDFIARTKQLVSGYRGALLDPEMMRKLDVFLKYTDAETAEYVAHVRAKNRGKVIPPFEAPYLDSVMGDLRLFSPDVQTSLLSIRAHLGMLNDHIETSAYYERLTFTNLEGENYATVVANGRQGLQQVGKLSRRIAEMIQALYPEDQQHPAGGSAPR
jgi:hypothetical protein